MGLYVFLLNVWCYLCEVTIHGHSPCHGGCYCLTLAFTTNGNVSVRKPNINLTWYEGARGSQVFLDINPFHYPFKHQFQCSLETKRLQWKNFAQCACFSFLTSSVFMVAARSWAAAGLLLLYAFTGSLMTCSWVACCAVNQRALVSCHYVLLSWSGPKPTGFDLD